MMTLLFGTLEYVMGTAKVIAHPSYEQLMEFCRRAQQEAKRWPQDAAFIASTGADLPAWPSKWRYRGYEWAGEWSEGELVTICVYDMGKRGYVRVELDYTLPDFRGMGLAAKLHHDLESLWHSAGMLRFKTKAGSVAGVHLQSSLRRTFWGITPGGEFYVDHPLSRRAGEPVLPKDLSLFRGGRDEVAEHLRNGRFGLQPKAAALLANKLIIAGAER